MIDIIDSISFDKGNNNIKDSALVLPKTNQVMQAWIAYL